jgi:hypothetical protein
MSTAKKDNPGLWKRIVASVKSGSIKEKTAKFR